MGQTYFEIQCKHTMRYHYNDVIMGTMASPITSLTIVYSTFYSGADQRKHQSSASLAFAQMASNAENISIWWRHHVMDFSALAKISNIVVITAMFINNWLELKCSSESQRMLVTPHVIAKLYVDEKRYTPNQGQVYCEMFIYTWYTLISCTKKSGYWFHIEVILQQYHWDWSQLGFREKNVAACKNAEVSAFLPDFCL